MFAIEKEKISVRGRQTNLQQMCSTLVEQSIEGIQIRADQTKFFEEHSWLGWGNVYDESLS